MKFAYFVILICNIRFLNTRLLQTKPKTNNDFQTEKVEIICTSDNCPENKGTCIDDKTICRCNEGFIDVIKFNKNKNNEIENINEIYCNYHLKSSLTYFLIELFFPIGFGHFYSKNYIFGFFKLLLSISLCILSCTIIVKKEKKRLKLFFVIISLSSTVGWFIWHITDLIKIMKKEYNDGLGFPLY